MGLFRAHPPRGQGRNQNFPAGGVVIHHQHADSGESCGGRSFLRFRFGPQAEAGGEPEFRPLALHAFHADFAAHHLGQLPGNGQPEAGAAESPRRGGIHLGKLPEEQTDFVFGNSDSGVPHGEAQQAGIAVIPIRPLPLLRPADAHHNFPPIGEFHRIADQIGENLAETPRIARKLQRRVGSDGTEQFELLAAGFEGDCRKQVIQQVLQIEFENLQIELFRLDLRKIQDIVDQSEQRFGAGFDAFGIAPLVRGEFGIEQKIRHTDDSIHRSSDFMTHVGQEIAFGAGGLFRLDEQLVGANRFAGQTPVQPLELEGPEDAEQQQQQKHSRHVEYQNIIHPVVDDDGNMPVDDDLDILRGDGRNAPVQNVAQPGHILADADGQMIGIGGNFAGDLQVEPSQFPDGVCCHRPGAQRHIRLALLHHAKRLGFGRDRHDIEIRIIPAEPLFDAGVFRKNNHFVAKFLRVGDVIMLHPGHKYIGVHEIRIGEDQPCFPGGSPVEKGQDMAFPGFRQLQGFAPILCRQDFKLDAGAFTDQADQIRCNPDVFALSGKLLIRIPVGIDPGKNRTELFKAGALFRRQPDALPRRQRPRRSGTGVIVAAGFMAEMPHQSPCDEEDKQQGNRTKTV